MAEPGFPSALHKGEKTVTQLGSRRHLSYRGTVSESGVSLAHPGVVSTQWRGLVFPAPSTLGRKQGLNLDHGVPNLGVIDTSWGGAHTMAGPGFSSALCKGEKTGTQLGPRSQNPGVIDTSGGGGNTVAGHKGDKTGTQLGVQGPNLRGH